MAQLIVTAKKLNKRKVVPVFLPDPNNIIGVVNENFTFEGEEVNDVPNTALGKWYKDRDGAFYWGGGVSLNNSFQKAFSIKKKTFQWFNDLEIEEIWSQYNEKGSSVTIAVLDTGYNTDILDVKNAVFKKEIIIDSNKYPLDQLIINDKSNQRHGNRCASIIGARNELDWLVGIAPECKLIIGKISINRELRTFDYILNGIKWALEQGADIISISYAVELTSDLAISYNAKFEELLKNNKSTLIFAAAGNSDGTQIITDDRYPASFPKCISIGATDKNKALSNMTVLSSKTVLHAQGLNIESYGPENIPDPQSGTSFSTPIVAGIAGLAISYLKRKGEKIDRETFLTKLISTGDPMIGQTNKKSINIQNLFKLL